MKIPTKPNDVILETQENPWSLAAKHSISCIIGDWTSPLEIATSVHAFIFDSNGRVLMSLEVDRGWDIPGGHIEPGETIEQTLVREIREEGGVELHSYQYFGRMQVDIFEPVPPTYRYPHPQANLPFFVSTDFTVLDFKRTKEDLDRKFFTKEDLERIPNKISSNTGAIKLLDRAREIAFPS